MLWNMPVRRTTRAETSLIGGFQPERNYRKKIYEQSCKEENVQT